MKVHPLQDRLLVRVHEHKSVTAGGIIIPDSAKEAPREGTVVAVGAGKRQEDGTVTALDVKPGDKVMYGRWAGTEIKLEGVEHIIVREDEILGVIS